VPVIFEADFDLERNESSSSSDEIEKVLDSEDLPPTYEECFRNLNPPEYQV
jgi:hypothetical protein